MQRLLIFLSFFLLSAATLLGQAPSREVITLLDWKSGGGYLRPVSSLKVNQEFIQGICQDVEDGNLVVFQDESLSEEIGKKELIDIVFNQYFHGPCGGSEKHSAEEFTVSEAFSTLEKHFYDNISLGLLETWKMDGENWKANQTAVFLEIADPNRQMDSRYVWLRPLDLISKVPKLGLVRSYQAQARQNASVHYVLKTADFKIIAWRNAGEEQWEGKPDWRRRMRYEYGYPDSDSLIKAWSGGTQNPFIIPAQSKERGLRDPYVISIPYALLPHQHLPGIVPSDTSDLQFNRELFRDFFFPAVEAVREGKLKAYEAIEEGKREELKTLPDFNEINVAARVKVEGRFTNDSRGLRFFPQWITILGSKKGEQMGENPIFSIRIGEMKEPEMLLGRILQRQYYYFPVRINDYQIGSMKESLLLRHYTESGLWEDVPDEITLKEIPEEIFEERLRIWYGPRE